MHPISHPVVADAKIWARIPRIFRQVPEASLAMGFGRSRASLNDLVGRVKKAGDGSKTSQDGSSGLVLHRRTVIVILAHCPGEHIQDHRSCKHDRGEQNVASNRLTEKWDRHCVAGDQAIQSSGIQSC